MACDGPTAQLAVRNAPLQPDAVQIGQVDVLVIVEFKVGPGGSGTFASIVVVVAALFQRDENMTLLATDAVNFDVSPSASLNSK